MTVGCLRASDDSNTTVVDKNYDQESGRRPMELFCSFPWGPWNGFNPNSGFATTVMSSATSHCMVWSLINISAVEGVRPVRMVDPLMKLIFAFSNDSIHIHIYGNRHNPIYETHDR